MTAGATSSSVSRVAADQQQSAFAALTIAFSGDPIMRWLYPEASDYLANFPGFL